MNHPLRRLALISLPLLLGIFATELVAAEPSPADLAWKELRKAATPPTPPREWSTRKPGEEELATFNRERAAKALAAADRARAFYTGHAADKRAAEARVLEYDLLSAVVQLGDASVTDRMIALQDALAGDPAVDPERRLSMVLIAAKGALQGGGDDPTAGMLKAKGVFLKAFEMFPARPEPAAYLLQLAEMLLAYDQPDEAREILDRLDREGIDVEVREKARAQRTRFEHLGKPVEIAFTAIDGRKVDVAALKGRVVLIDFWATWCGPCIAGLPELKEQYARWQEKGFEIVGVSLDNDLAALKDLVRERELAWPQFFDEENETNRYATKYGITGIPTLWLIDKRGQLRYLNARSDLSGKIAGLMAEE